MRQLIVTCRSSGHKNFAGRRSLENLFGFRPLLGRGRVPEVCSGSETVEPEKKSENLVFRGSLGDASFRSRAATSASASISASASVAASVFV